MNGDRFIVDYIFPIFSARNASDMFHQMIWISIFYTLSVLVSMLLFPAPYGRYSSGRYGFLLPGRLAWMIQESPAFIVPIVLLFTTSSPCWDSMANKILVMCLVNHYIQRYFQFDFTLCFN